ncbi:MAG: LOG family protein [Chlamydiales bacterium]|nr:LOG family protein [Chlamydiales bacterium]
MNIAQLDLVTPDAKITKIERIDPKTSIVQVIIENIHPNFVGFEIEPELVFFNIKSTLAQIGLNGIGQKYDLDKALRVATVEVRLHAIGPIAREMLALITVGAYIGKLFAADTRRRVRDPDYLTRMFGRSDRQGRPLLSLGGMQGSDNMILDKVDGRTIAYLALKNGRITYESSIFGFLPTMAKALHDEKYSLRNMLHLHQAWLEGATRNVEDDEILLLRTSPLHIRTVFARVVDELLSPGYTHTTASVLQPDTTASGDVYELYGSSKRELNDIPLEFYTLEPYREHVFFSDRDQLQICLEDVNSLFTAFNTAPQPIEERTSVFVVKGQQMKELKSSDWTVKPAVFHDLPGITHGTRQALLISRFIEQQPTYPYLKAIEDGDITSQGVLLTRYFPSPIMKRMLLSDRVSSCLKGIYFQYPSCSHGQFFSYEDRAMMNDLYKFAIPVYWVDEITGKVLQYVQKPKRETGMFVPLNQTETFIKATTFGVYGSNLLSGGFDELLTDVLKGVIEMRSTTSHPLLKSDTPLVLITGGGPGAMETGNRIAKDLKILSGARLSDFRSSSQAVVNEQRANPYIEAKMTYRHYELVERQAEFNLDFPIFVMGGIGTDFEYCLEEVRRKVGCVMPTPILLVGELNYWKDKITSRFQANLNNGTIKGSEWVSSCFYCVQTAQQALDIYRRYFKGELIISKDSPMEPLGFVNLA